MEYMEEYVSMREELHETLRPMTIRNLIFTGHGVGGALSILASADFTDFYRSHFHTFGTPPFGDVSMVKWLNKNISRRNMWCVINSGDPIPLCLSSSSTKFVHPEGNTLILGESSNFEIDELEGENNHSRISTYFNKLVRVGL
jgi:hypothetical protein